MASRISFTAVSASFAIRFGNRDAMAAMRSERVKVRIQSDWKLVAVVEMPRTLMRSMDHFDPHAAMRN